MKWDEIQPEERATQSGAIKWDDLQAQSTKQPAEEPGIVDRIGNAVKRAIVGQKEDYPEFSSPRVGNIHDARTLGGKLNMIRRAFPDAELDFDEYGTPLVRLGPDPMGETGAVGKFLQEKGIARRHEPDQPMYLNKPGLSMGDVDMVQAGLERAILPAAASVTAGPAGWATAAPIVGAAGALGETLSQTGANISGADEGYSGLDILKAAGYSAAGEGAGRVIAHGLGTLGNVFRRIAGKQGAAVQYIDDAGRLTDDAIELLKKHQLTPDDLAPMLRRELEKAKAFTPEEAARYNEFRNMGMQPTRGQVTRDPAQQSFEYNAPGEHGKAFSQRFSAQNERLLGEMEDVRQVVGGADDPLASGVSVQHALRSKSGEMKEGVSKLYTAAREAKGVNTPLPPKSADKFYREAVEVLDDFEDVVPSAIRKRLIEYGTLGNQTRDLTVGETDSFIKLLNQHYNPTNPPQAAAIDRLRNAMKSAVDMLGEGDDAAAKLFTQGRKAAVERHAEFSQKDIVEQIVKKKAAATDKIPAEKIFDKVIRTGSIQDLGKIKKSLLSGSPQQVQRGLDAMRDMKASALRHLYEKATNRYTVDQMGNPIFSSANFKKEMERIGMQKLSMLFGSDELSRLNTIARLGELRIPVEGTVNTSRTGPAAFNILERMLDKLPGGSTLLGTYRLGKAATQEGRLAKDVAAALSPEKATVAAIKKGTKEAAKASARAKSISPRVGAAAGSQER